jgi:hypothetical protein
MNFFCRYFTVIFTNYIFPSLTPSVNTNRNMSSVYTKGIIVGIEGIKKSNSMMTCKFLQMSLLTKLQLDSYRQAIPLMSLIPIGLLTD